MRGVTPASVFAAFGVVSVLAAAPAQDPPQTPSQTPSQAPPVFRGEVDVIRLDVSVLDRSRQPVQRVTLAPGRYEMRLNAMSRALDRGASVFATVEVPDVSRVPLTLSGVLLGRLPAPGTARTDVLAPILPIVPTSARTFTASDHIAAFVRVFQGGSRAAPVTLQVAILDRRDRPVLETSEVINADAFADASSIAREIALPLDRLTTGPHLLTITAEGSEGARTRRDVTFRIR